MPQALPVRVMLVDDHPVVIEGLRSVLALHDDLVCVGTAASASELSALLPHTEVDVVVLDYSLGRDNGAALVELVQRVRPGTRTIIYSMLPPARARFAAADAFVCKTTDVSSLLDAIRRVHRGERQLSSVADAPARARVEASLSPREQQVLALLTSGYSPGEIAATLEVAPSTISTHLRRIRDKVGGESQAELVLEALRRRL